MARDKADLPEELWTLEETAAYLRKPPATLYTWASRGTGPRSYKIGRARMYDPADLKEWLKRQATEPAA